MRGEIVLMIAGNPSPMLTDWETLTPEEHVAFLQKEYGISQKEAIIAVAKLRGVSKRDVYNKLLA